MSDRRSLAEDAQVVAPAECPFCRSRTLSTAAGRPRASNYWRCDTCGQLWNPERLRQSAPPDYRRR